MIIFTILSVIMEQRRFSQIPSHIMWYSDERANKNLKEIFSFITFCSINHNSNYWICDLLWGLYLHTRTTYIFMIIYNVLVCVSHILCLGTLTLFGCNVIVCFECCLFSRLVYESDVPYEGCNIMGNILGMEIKYKIAFQYWHAIKNTDGVY